MLIRCKNVATFLHYAVNHKYEDKKISAHLPASNTRTRTLHVFLLVRLGPCVPYYDLGYQQPSTTQVARRSVLAQRGFFLPRLVTDTHTNI
jgi:hypothetical protein